MTWGPPAICLGNQSPPEAKSHDESITAGRAFASQRGAFGLITPGPWLVERAFPYSHPCIIRVAMSEKETPTNTDPQAESSAASSSLPPPPQFEPAKLEAVKAYRSVGLLLPHSPSGKL